MQQARHLQARRAVIAVDPTRGRLERALRAARRRRRRASARTSRSAKVQYGALRGCRCRRRRSRVLRSPDRRSPGAVWPVAARGSQRRARAKRRSRSECNLTQWTASKARRKPTFVEELHRRPARRRTPDPTPTFSSSARPGPCPSDDSISYADSEGGCCTARWKESISSGSSAAPAAPLSTRVARGWRARVGRYESSTSRSQLARPAGSGC